MLYINIKSDLKKSGLAFALISPAVFILQNSAIYAWKEDTEAFRKWCGKALYCKRVQSYGTKRKKSIFANMHIL